MAHPLLVITGGAGFIGSNLAAEVAARGTHRVVICDHFGTDAKWRNLRNHAVYEIVAPSNLFYWLEMFAAQVDAVIHLGAISTTTEIDVDRILENNVTLSTLLYRWCAENAKRLIYASSAATYGDGEQGFDDTGNVSQLNRLRPMNPYGWSKHLVDRFIAMALENGEPAPPQWVGLKFFNVYGPNEYHKGAQRSVVCLTYPAVARGEAMRLFRSYKDGVPDGGQARDFIYVRDCVDVMLWLLDTPAVSGLFNLGTGTARSFNDLARALFSSLSMTPDITYIDMPEALQGKYQYFTQSRVDKLRAAGYTRPFTALEDGVRDYVQRFLSQPDPYR